MKRFFILLLATATFLCAQEFRGTFSGSLTDATGAAIPKAKITAIETQTGTKATVYSEPSGAYTIRSWRPASTTFPPRRRDSRRIFARA